MDSSETPVPSGLALTALDQNFRQNPSAVLDVLRSREPVHKDRMFDRVVLTSAADVFFALNDSTLSSDPLKSRPGSFSRQILGIDKDFVPIMLHLDDPDHKRLRNLVVQAFNVRAVEAIRGQIHQIADRLLDAVAGQSSFDVVEAYAKPLPTIVIAVMMGVNEKDQESFKRWSDERAHIFNPNRTPEQAKAVVQSLEAISAYVLKMIEERRNNRGTDLISKLISVEESGEHLTVPEIVNICNLLIVAGNLTTTDLLSNGVLALLQHPDELERLRRHPELITTVVEEVLRYDSPVMQVERVPVQARTISGVNVEAGQTITCSLFAANRDPAVHATPDVFDIARGYKQHYSFGGGSHFCIGAPLARVEAQVGLSTLFQRFPKIRLTPAVPPVRKSVPAFNGLASLLVEVG
jgi:cytochrome P450